MMSVQLGEGGTHGGGLMEQSLGVVVAMVLCMCVCEGELPVW